MHKGLNQFGTQKDFPGAELLLRDNLVTVVPFAQFRLNDRTILGLSCELSPTVGGHVCDVHKVAVVIG